MGTLGLAPLGPGIKQLSTATRPERGHTKAVRRRPPREVPRLGCGQHLMDGWGARGIVHSNKETSGKLTLCQGGAHGARRLQPTRGPCGQGRVALTVFPDQGRQTDNSNKSCSGALLPNPLVELRVGGSGPKPPAPEHVGRAPCIHRRPDF